MEVQIETKITNGIQKSDNKSGKLYGTCKNDLRSLLYNGFSLTPSILKCHYEIQIDDTLSKWNDKRHRRPQSPILNEITGKTTGQLKHKGILKEFISDSER